MKKVLIIISLSLLLFGCGKEQKNITVNIYGNDKVVADVKQNETKTDNNINSDTEKDKEIENKVDKNSSNNTVVTQKEDNSNNYSVPNESTANNNASSNETEEKKGWYATNKDELKDISKEILEDDVNSLKGLVSGAKDWFNKNKDGLTEAANDIYYSDKEAINNLKDKFKK